MTVAQRRARVQLVPLGDREALGTRCLLAGNDEPELTLGQLLTEQPALSLAPLSAELLRIRVARLNISLADPQPDQPLYWPEGIRVAATTAGAPAEPASGEPAPGEPAPGEPAASGGGAKPGRDHPAAIDESTAVRIAHDTEIAKSAAYLDAGLSVLVRCEKLLVEHLAKEIAGRSGRTPRVVEAPSAATGGAVTDPTGMQGGRRQQTLAALQGAVRNAKVATDVVIVPHLDLLAGGSDASINAEARELTDVLYERSDTVLLAFVDPSLVIPEVLANRFAVRIAIDILPREVFTREGERVPIGRALVTEEEAGVFAGFDAVTLYKHIAGMNAVRLRHALRFAMHQHGAAGSTFGQLVAELRTFKAATSSSFEVPNVPFNQIGGYQEVREELERALAIIKGADGMPEYLRHELVPRGFIFYGPPGTGKTLFAKAVATAFDATILVVSGPEVTDMYVGESERKVREIFAEARRNAPAVVVFDEFDSIASRRTGRDDGGSRAGNAIVAQLLTEMDGFRSEVPVLIIGTTNRLDIIDDALLRPSRFRPIRVDLPDTEARRAIAKVHADHFEIPYTDALLDRIAIVTNRMNGDDIRSIFRDARADSLVGNPRRPPDAQHLGELVGALRRAAQERDAERGQAGARRPGAGTGATRATAERTVLPTLVNLTPSDLVQEPMAS